MKTGRFPPSGSIHTGGFASRRLSQTREVVVGVGMTPFDDEKQQKKRATETQRLENTRAENKENAPHMVRGLE